MRLAEDDHALEETQHVVMAIDPAAGARRAPGVRLVEVRGGECKPEWPLFRPQDLAPAVLADLGRARVAMTISSAGMPGCGCAVRYEPRRFTSTQKPLPSATMKPKSRICGISTRG